VDITKRTARKLLERHLILYFKKIKARGTFVDHANTGSWENVMKLKIHTNQEFLLFDAEWR
tara:strand:+ start:2641 stop:2823 length:183 start_codon:yes stop_codon:yes gene_type:complete